MLYMLEHGGTHLGATGFNTVANDVLNRLHHIASRLRSHQGYEYLNLQHPRCTLHHNVSRCLSVSLRECLIHKLQSLLYSSQPGILGIVCHNSC